MDAIKLDFHHTGDLAYYDSFDGMIPCKILDIEDRFDQGNMTHKYITARITATRKGWKKGDLYTARDYRFIPRNCVHVKDGNYLIRNNFTWVLSWLDK